MLKRKSQAAESTHGFGSELCAVINKSRAKRVESNSVRPQLKPRLLNLRNRLNSRSKDLRIRLNRPKFFDLRRKLEETKAKAGDEAEPIIEDLFDDLGIQLRIKRVERATFLNVIMGGSPHCGESVRSVKDYRRQVVTPKKWPSKPENDHQITFSPDDDAGVHA